MKKRKDSLEKARKELVSKDPLIPIDIDSIGASSDPCFGKGYDLTTNECKMCGDSELCCIKFAAALGKTRKELEKENDYKDLETLVDIPAVKKTIRALKRKGEDRKTIRQKLQAKYHLSESEAKELYRKYKPKNQE